MADAKDVIELLYAKEDPVQKEVLCRFFKTGKGEYGEGDCFLGLKVPQTRSIVKRFRCSLSLEEIGMLLDSVWHEVRLCGLLLLVEEMKNALPKRGESPQSNADRRKCIADFYLLHARQANNWDLVDLSCVYILGTYLMYPMSDGDMPSRSILDSLAMSDNLWEQRISIVSTLMFIRVGQFEDTLRIAEKLLSHPHDLIHKATGWMLREIGKRDIEVLRGFLNRYSDIMPRTMLRYSIEKMSVSERKYWMKS